MTPEPVPYYLIGPHYFDDSSSVAIEEIVTRVYGKPYASLEGCRHDHENLSNDCFVTYDFADEEEMLEALDQFDEPRVYLGYDKQAREMKCKDGTTDMAYWLSIGVAPTRAEATVDANPEPGTDLEGALFEDAFFAARAFTPSLGGILADLIRRGEIPAGNYLYRHAW